MPDLSAIARQFGLPSADPRLMEAFTHRSYAVEHHLEYDNQRLEFLGDSVLEIIFTEYLFNLYPSMTEGDLTKLRSALACEGALARLARELDLGSALRTGHGEEESNGQCRESTLADLFEAFIGALYLDLGFDKVRDFVLEILKKELDNPKQLLVELNPKGQLQELSQQYWNEIPVYKVFLQSGPQHCPCYEVEASLHNCIAIGRGRSRKIAECSAASSLYNYLQKKMEL